MAVISKDLGPVTAYAAAVNRGYTGTREEFETLMASYATVAERAGESASQAAGSASDAESSASQAAASANDASGSASQAAQSAGNASRSATAACIAQTAAESARDAAQVAQTAAETAQAGAEAAVDGFDSAVTRAIFDVNTAGTNQKELAKRQAEKSEAWAVGQINGEDVGVSDPAYHNNAKYYAGQASVEKTAAQQARQGAETAQGLAETAQDKAEEAQTAAETAQTKAEEAAERVDVKSDGTYDSMTVGNAGQLISKKMIVDTEPYLFRSSGGNGADREYDEIVGGSIVWNQLNALNNLVFSAGTLTKNSDNSVTITYEREEEDTTTRYAYLSEVAVPYISSHVYLITSNDYYNDGGARFYIRGSVNSIPIGKNYRFLKDANEDSGSVITRASIPATAKSVNITAKVQVFDLTKMFGSTIANYIYNLETATEGAGITWFRKYFPKEYYEYNPGEIMSVEGLTSHDLVGFNAWDEEWEIGYFYDTGDTIGQKRATTDRIRSKNYIPCLPNTVYNYTMGTAKGRIFFYDKEYNYISFRDYSAAKTFTTPENCWYMMFNTNAAYGTSYNHDICVNLSWDGERDGEYEPYVKHSYPLDPTLTLRGMPVLSGGNLAYDGDRYKADGTVERRYGIVDLGTLDWIVHKADTGVFKAAVTGIKKIVSNSIVANLLCDKYTASASAAMDDKTIAKAVSNTSLNIYLKDSGYANVSAEAFGDAMSGVYLVYELEEPTTETATAYQSPQIVDDFGTEEYVTTSIVPVGHETKYPDNLRAKIDGLPWNFANLIAPVETMYKATRNYTTGSLLIVDNVLYRATANIANGGNITPNTNCTATTLAEIIAAL